MTSCPPSHQLSSCQIWGEQRRSDTSQQVRGHLSFHKSITWFINGTNTPSDQVMTHYETTAVWEEMFCITKHGKQTNSRHSEIYKAQQKNKTISDPDVIHFVVVFISHLKRSRKSVQEEILLFMQHCPRVATKTHNSFISQPVAFFFLHDVNSEWTERSQPINC